MGNAGRQAIEELAAEYEFCERCPRLVDSRRHIIFGGGSSSAPLMVIGEAPGEGEDAANIVFWGDSGQLLMDLLSKAWPEDDDVLEELKRIQEDGPYFEALREYLDEWIFWTNIVLCRPQDNRVPTTAEIKLCSARLHRAIYAVDPLLIIGVGATAASALLGKKVAITDAHGTLYDIKIPSPVTGAPVRYPMLAVLHPAHLLRKGDLKLVKRKQGLTYSALEDLRFGLQLVHGLCRQRYGRSLLEKP